jgi:hypothetical protein
MLTLSQVIYGVQDLDVATRQIESRGFTIVDDGHHPGLGTANRIVPLEKDCCAIGACAGSRSLFWKSIAVRCKTNGNGM